MTRSASTPATSVIAGIDEAGRGALAGPVVAGACILPKIRIPRFIRDSKQLTPEQREEAFAWIEAKAMYGWGLSEAQDIDTEGILTATERAMQRAVMMLEQTLRPTYLLIDGRDHFWFDYPHSSIIHGDVLEACIAAASIVAKVTRDRLMCRRARVFRPYGFEVHKGYGTEEHFCAIKRFGPCVLHRHTFLRNVIIHANSPTTEHPDSAHDPHVVRSPVSTIARRRQ
ncbi:MAG: ribonuclease HII [Candidatus Peribacteraceae bacterium]|nr:ribonuclease HII [Candidatus Peribacteraceae bacterium]